MSLRTCTKSDSPMEWKSSPILGQFNRWMVVPWQSFERFCLGNRFIENIYEPLLWSLLSSFKEKLITKLLLCTSYGSQNFKSAQQSWIRSIKFITQVDSKFDVKLTRLGFYVLRMSSWNIIKVAFKLYRLFMEVLQSTVYVDYNLTQREHQGFVNLSRLYSLVSHEFGFTFIKSFSASTVRSVKSEYNITQLTQPVSFRRVKACRK